MWVDDWWHSAYWRLSRGHQDCPSVESRTQTSQHRTIWHWRLTSNATFVVFNNTPCKFGVVLCVNHIPILPSPISITDFWPFCSLNMKFAAIITTSLVAGTTAFQPTRKQNHLTKNIGGNVQPVVPPVTRNDMVAIRSPFWDAFSSSNAKSISAGDYVVDRDYTVALTLILVGIWLTMFGPSKKSIVLLYLWSLLICAKHGYVTYAILLTQAKHPSTCSEGCFTSYSVPLLACRRWGLVQYSPKTLSSSRVPLISTLVSHPTKVLSRSKGRTMFSELRTNGDMILSSTGTSFQVFIFQFLFISRRLR